MWNVWRTKSWNHMYAIVGGTARKSLGILCAIHKVLFPYDRLDQYVWTNKLAWTVRGSSLQFLTRSGRSTPETHRWYFITSFLRQLLPRTHDLKAMFPEGKIHEPLGLELTNYREQRIRLALKTTEFNNMFVSVRSSLWKEEGPGKGATFVAGSLIITFWCALWDYCDVGGLGPYPK